MLNFMHLLLVSTTLLSFMSMESSSQDGRLIKRIENMDIKIGTMVKVPPKPDALMSTLALSSDTLLNGIA